MAETVSTHEKYLIEQPTKIDYKILKHILFYDDIQDLTKLKRTLESNEWILFHVYDQGFLDILQQLYELQIIDVNKAYSGKTGLQIACEKGYVDIVTWLLEHGAEMKNAYDENCEFYLATLNGNQDVLAVLLKQQPKMVADRDVRYCLLYAACQGGHLELVKYWFSPDMDVSEKTFYISDLSKCEQMYPLFAACEGNHFEVAKFLIQEGEAAITKDICYYFPEFSARLVRSLFLKSDINGQQFFHLSKRKIECLLPCWFSAPEKQNMDADVCCGEVETDVNKDEDTFDIVIEAQENRLQELPDGVLWSLVNMISLDASHNPLKSIPGALNPGSLHLNGLKILNFEHCLLESVSSDIFSLPCLEHVNLSHNRLHTLSVNDDACHTAWTCTELKSLDISHNLLDSIPSKIQVCAHLICLNASHNQLQTTCMPWQCPMESLDLSYNKLSTFPPSAYQYWGKTLKKLHLQHNQMTELAESIVRMRNLSNLDVSHNKIQQMPQPSLWSCPLFFFNLNHNMLGVGAWKKSMEFPVSCLASTLNELCIADNHLEEVPPSISDLRKLFILDISDNKIRSLPLELGKLRSLAILKGKGIKVKDAELDRLITSLNNGVKDVYASSIIKYLDRTRRKCVRAGILKIIVLGCKNKDGYCIVQDLANKRNVQAAEHEELTVTEMILKPKKVKLKIWELPDSKVTSSVLPCFLTLNSIYLIVHDVSIYGADVHSVSEKVASIQACVLHPYIIVVCTYSKLLDQDEQKRLEKAIFSKLGKILPKAMLVSIISGACSNSSVLQQAVNSLWEIMSDAACDPNAKICQRQVPGKFLEVMDKMARFKKNMCRMSELLQAVSCNIKDLEDGIDQNLTLRNFLLQAGSLLHYNMHVGELSDCVILNPAWLFDLLSKFLQNVMTRNNKKAGQLPLKIVRDRLQEMLPKGDFDYFPAILKLMEAFNIGVRLMDNASKEEEIFLVPSLLPKQPPEYQLDADKDACKAARLYCLPAVPPALWSNLISQLILAFNRYSASKWGLGEQKFQASRSSANSGSYVTSGKPSMQGLHINNKNIQYWRTMIMMYYDQGHVVVEEVECKSSSEASAPGILVTVQTTGSGTADDLHELSPARNEKKLSIMGIVLDELEEILERFNPKFRDLYDANLSEVYAICPRCNEIKPGLGRINLKGIHFTVKDCAQMLLSVNAVVCQDGPSSLSCLVPELIFNELPSEMHLSPNDLILTDEKLGRGMTGDVRKGVYRGTDVAVKVFYNPGERPFVPNNPNIQYNNIADAATEFQAKQYEINTEQIKISNAFTDVRREVGILSKLSHEFIVTFIGLCIRPQLLLALELAPFGSLRTQLDKKAPDILCEIQHTDKVISQLVFSKDLTYKIIFQIGSGLCYLHKNSIIYRDLKPDNILVMSLSVEDRVNVKLSDYGISKFKTLSGVTGVFGTVGYMAPEMLLKRPYTEKADIYSFAIVIAEILTGIPPIDSQHFPCLSFVDTTGNTPGHLKDYQIKCRFPALESLIKECWSPEMDDRPSSAEVFKMIKSDQFLLLYDSLILERNAGDGLEVTCVYSCQTHRRWRIWVSESGQGNNRFISVYDVETSGFMVYRKLCCGPRISGMAKDGQRIWVVNKELNSLEVIERGNQSNFEVSCSFTLDAVATKVVNHIYEKSEEKRFLLIGLENGWLTAIHSRSSPCKSVTAHTNTELHRATPVADICSIDCHRIAVASGMAVFFLNVTLPDCQEDVKRIWIPDLVNSGTVSLKHVAHVYSPVVALVAEGNSVWCCLENSSCLVKIDVDLMRIVLIVTVSWSPLSDAVRLEEIDIVERPPLQLFASDSAAELRILDDDKDALALASNGRLSVGDDVFSKKELKEMVGMHCSSESDINAAKIISEEHVSTTKSNDFTRNRSQTTNNNDKPPLPPPRIKKSALERAVSMPGLQEKPPLVPERPRSQENNISITSLCVTGDILAIGTSNGGILLLPLIYHTVSDKSGRPPSLPFQLPLLRHPSTKKEHAVKSQSQNVFARKGRQSAGSVSCLTLAGKNLVSLYSPAQVSRRIRSGTDSGRKRFGIIINGNRLNICNEADKDIQDFAQTPAGNAESVGCHEELPVLFSHFAASDSDNMQLPAVADIAIWDNISWSRLQTVRSYSHELIGCKGWCCHAPSLAG